MNPFTQLICNKAHILSSQFEQSKAIIHKPTKGSLREAYIRSFLCDIIPKNSELFGGFITDAYGNISPQIDLIGIEEVLPIIKLDQGTCVAPIESVRYWVEVKSVLQSQHLQELIERLNSIDRMTWHLINRTQPIGFKANFRPPAFVVAYESEVAEDKLKEWLSENEYLFAVVVIGKYAIGKFGNTEPTDTIYNKGNNEELLFLASKLHQIFILMSRVLENVRTNISNLPEKPTQEDLKIIRENQVLDMVHYSTQIYFESDKLDRNARNMI